MYCFLLYLDQLLFLRLFLFSFSLFTVRFIFNTPIFLFPIFLSVFPIFSILTILSILPFFYVYLSCSPLFHIFHAFNTYTPSHILFIDFSSHYIFDNLLLSLSSIAQFAGYSHISPFSSPSSLFSSAFHPQYYYHCFCFSFSLLSPSSLHFLSLSSFIQVS